MRLARKSKLSLKMNCAQSPVTTITNSNDETEVTPNTPLKTRIIPMKSPMHLLEPGPFHKESVAVPAKDEGNFVFEESHLIQVVLKEVLPNLKKIEYFCGLEVKLKCGDWRVLIIKSAKINHVIRCRVVCDINRGKILVKPHTSMLASMITSLVPVPIRAALFAIKKGLNEFPLGNSASTSILSSHILKFILSIEEERAREGRDISDLLTNSELEGTQSVTTLLDSLLCLDIKLRLTSEISILLKRKEWFPSIAKGEAELDVRRGMQLVKQPRNVFNRKKLSFATDRLNEWINMTRSGTVSRQVFQLIRYTCLNQSHHRGDQSIAH